MAEISIVTPSLNRADLLPRLWSSLRNEKANFQWIVVDDGSTDATPQVVTDFKDPRISFQKLKKNMGVNFARNAGVELAKGNYIIFLDSDDELVAGALEDAVKK